MKLARGVTPTVLVLGALITATLTAGVTYASTASKGVKACASSGGTLGLLKHGRCAKGERQITLGAAGPRGLAGERGETGAAGPGAVSSVAVTTDTETALNGAAKTVGNVTILTQCTAGSLGEVSIQPRTASHIDGIVSWDPQGAKAVASVTGFDSDTTTPSQGVIPVDLAFTSSSEFANSLIQVTLPHTATSDDAGQLWGSFTVNQGGLPTAVQFEINLTTTNCTATVTATPST